MRNIPGLPSRQELAEHEEVAANPSAFGKQVRHRDRGAVAYAVCAVGQSGGSPWINQFSGERQQNTKTDTDPTDSYSL